MIHGILNQTKPPVPLTLTATAPGSWRCVSTSRFAALLSLAAALFLAGQPAAAGVRGDWEFSEAASPTGTTADSSGNGYDGTLVGFDAGTGLNGSGQAVWAANNANRITTAMPLNFAEDIQVDMTFTYTGPANRSWTPLLGSSVAPYNANQIFYVGKQNNVAALNVNIAGVHSGTIANSAFLFNGSQHTLVLTYEKATDLLTFYADGNATPFASVTGSRPENGCIISPTTTLWIGATGHGFSGGEVWVGSMDRVIVHDAIPRPPIVITQEPTPIAAPAGTVTNLAVTVTGGLPSYQWYKDTVPILDATNASLVFDPLRTSDAGDYQVLITNATSAATSVVATVTVTAPDTTPPTVVSVEALGDATRVLVEFSEVVTAATAQDVFSYQITNAAGFPTAVLEATLGPDGRTVTLTTEPMQEEAEYMLVVTDIEDLAEPPNVITAGTLVAFRYSVRIGHWPLDGNGTDLAAGNHAVIMGNPLPVAGKVGSAFQFDGNAANHLAVPAAPRYGLTNFTLAAWVYIPDLAPTGWKTILEYNRSGANWYGLWRSGNANATDKLHFRWSNGTTARSDFTTAIAPNHWYHVAGTLADGVAKLYLNGVLDVTVPNATPPTPAPTNSALRIGANLADGEGFPGMIDDVRVYGRALNDAEIAALVSEVFTPIGITQEPAPVAATEGTVASLTVVVTGDDPRFQWYQNAAAIAGATNAMLAFDPLRPDDAGDYQVVVTNLVSAATSVVATVTITAPDTTPPTVVSVLALGSATRIIVGFSERVGLGTAEDVFNYTITNAVGFPTAVLAATLGADRRTVTLTTEAMQEGESYTLVVSGVEDLAATPNPMAVEELRPFTYATLVGHWPLDGDGTDVAAGNDGVIAGNLTTVAGQIGTAFQSDGNATNHLAVAASPLYGLTNLTLSAWIYLPDLAPAGWRAILEHNRHGGNWYGLWRSGNAGATNKLHFRWANADPSRMDFASTLLPNQWSHVAGTFADGVAKLYLNGTLDLAVTNTVAPTLAPTNSALRIGANLDGAEGFPGLIDDVRIYGRALNEAEVAALANPTPLQFLAPVVSGAQIMLDWTGTGRLEWAASVLGPWNLIEPAPAAPPHPVDLVPGANRFFRLNATPLP